jgi:hypothetical protein
MTPIRGVLTAGELDLMAECLEEGLELGSVVALNDEDAVLTGAAGAEGLFAVLEDLVEVGVCAGEADDKGAGFAAFDRLTAVEPNDAVGGVGGEGVGGAAVRGSRGLVTPRWVWGARGAGFADLAAVAGPEEVGVAHLGDASVSDSLSMSSSSSHDVS